MSITTTKASGCFTIALSNRRKACSTVYFTRLWNTSCRLVSCSTISTQNGLKRWSCFVSPIFLIASWPSNAKTPYMSYSCVDTPLKISVLWPSVTTLLTTFGYLCKTAPDSKIASILGSILISADLRLMTSVDPISSLTSVLSWFKGGVANVFPNAKQYVLWSSNFWVFSCSSCIKDMWSSKLSVNAVLGLPMLSSSSGKNYSTI